MPFRASTCGPSLSDIRTSGVPYLPTSPTTLQQQWGMDRTPGHLEGWETEASSCSSAAGDISR